MREEPDDRRYRIGVWSACFEVITGQALVTKHVVETTFHRNFITTLVTFQSGSSFSAIWSWVCAVRGLYTVISDGNLTIAYLVVSRSHFGFLRDLPALALTKYKIPRIVHAHGADIIELLHHRWYSPIARWLYSGATIIVPSSHLVQKLRSARFDVHAIDNPVSVPASISRRIANESVAGFPHANQDKKTNSSFTVCWNSNIMCSKGFTLVISACNILFDEGIPICLHVFGAPISDHEMSKQQMSSFIDLFASSPWVVFHGGTPRDIVLDKIMDSDVVTFPTFHPTESQGLAAVDAMILGRQLLVSRTPAMMATTKGYPAIIIDDRSVNGVKMGLLTAYKNKLDFNKTHAPFSEAIKKRFCPDRFNMKLLEILQSVIEK